MLFKYVLTSDLYW